MTRTDADYDRLAERSNDRAYELIRELHEEGMDGEELYVTLGSAVALVLAQCSATSRPKMLAALGEAARRYAGEVRPS